MKKNIELLLNLKRYNYAKSAIDNIPQTGMIGYITNNPISTFDFLSEPATRFNFNIKNFSQLKNTSIEKKLKLTNTYPLTPDLTEIYSLENKKRLNNHLFEDSGLNFLQNFPSDLTEAEELEKITGGLNLFVCFNYLNYEVNNEMQPNNYLIGTKGTVKLAANSVDDFDLEDSLLKGDEIINKDEQLNHFRTESILKGFDPENVEDLLDEDFQEIVPRQNSPEDNEALLKFYDERGLLMFFDVHPKEDIDSARLRFLSNMIKSFKY